MTSDELRRLKAFHNLYVNSHGEQPNFADCRTRDEFNAFIAGFDDGYLVGFKAGKKLAADEIDRLTAENERLRQRVAELERLLVRFRQMVILHPDQTLARDYDAAMEAKP